MALTINGTRFLLRCRRETCLGRTTVVGRQGLFAPPPLVRRLFAASGLTPAAGTDEFFRAPAAEWADGVFRALGADPLEFMDASAYEGATRIHDLNRPLNPADEESSDTLIDIGSLEHIFDVRVAIENYLRLVKVGGNVLLLDMPGVNFCGHGFYQFSPEFFCEILSSRHGFELRELALAENWAYAPFYRVARPRDRRRRVQIAGLGPSHLFVWARKVAPFRGFAGTVVQSDYAEAWAQPAPQSAPKDAGGAAGWARRTWQRFDPAGYWRFTTRRDHRRVGRTAGPACHPDLSRLDW